MVLTMDKIKLAAGHQEVEDDGTNDGGEHNGPGTLEQPGKQQLPLAGSGLSTQQWAPIQ